MDTIIYIFSRDEIDKETVNNLTVDECEAMAKTPKCEKLCLEDFIWHLNECKFSTNKELLFKTFGK